MSACIWCDTFWKLYLGWHVLQAAIRPPTFVFFVNDAKLFSDTYRRYMEKQLRSDAGFSGTPIRLLWRSRRKMDKGTGHYLVSQVDSILLGVGLHEWREG